MSEEKEVPVFDKESAHAESKNFLADLLLTDPETREKLFIATNVDMNNDGSVSIVCVSDIDSDTGIMHTIYSSHVSKSEEKEENVKPDSDIPIVDIHVPSSIVGLDGRPLF